MRVREEERLRLFENRVLTRIFRPKGEDMAGGWRRLRNLYASSNIRAIISWMAVLVGHVARIGEVRNAYRSLGGKSEWKRPLGRPKHRWQDVIRMDLREIGWEVDWIHLAQDRDHWRARVNTVMSRRVP
jgi:hypothetical protein